MDFFDGKKSLKHSWLTVALKTCETDRRIERVRESQCLLWSIVFFVEATCVIHQVRTPKRFSDSHFQYAHHDQFMRWKCLTLGIQRWLMRKVWVMGCDGLWYVMLCYPNDSAIPSFTSVRVRWASLVRFAIWVGGSRRVLLKFCTSDRIK